VEEKKDVVNNTNLIPNVLPEPKKHVKRDAVDYAVEVPEELLHFDHEISEEDDFDIK